MLMIIVYSLKYSFYIRNKSRGCLRNDLNFKYDQQYKTLNINFQNFIWFVIFQS